MVLTRTELVRLDTADRVGMVAPGALALAVLSTAFTSQAIATGFDRRNGVLRLLSTTPLGPGACSRARRFAILAVEVIQVVVLGSVAGWLGWRPTGIPAAPLLLALGTAAFTSLALLVAGTLRAEAVLAAANLVWVLLLIGGGVLPVALLPDGPAAVVRLLPSGGPGRRASCTHSPGRPWPGGPGPGAGRLDGRARRRGTAVASAGTECPDAGATVWPVSTMTPELSAAGDSADVPPPRRIDRRWERRILWANLIGQVTIVVTGGIVRLTASGLGCSTWPQCEPGQFAPVLHEATSWHP